MTERKVTFTESRTHRRTTGEIVKWWAGQTYDFDPAMEPMIELGHARVAGDDSEAVEAPQLAPEETAPGAAPANRAERRMQRRAPINANNAARPN